MIDASNITTYQAGTQQAQANRTLNSLKTNVLKKYDLSGMQWIVLGNIYDAGKSGIRASDLAKLLDTTQAFVTGTVNILVANDYVTRETNFSDSRSRLIKFNFLRKKLFLKIEEEARSELRNKIYSRITREELNIYLNVINKFADQKIT